MGLIVSGSFYSDHWGAFNPWIHCHGLKSGAIFQAGQLSGIIHSEEHCHSHGNSCTQGIALYICFSAAVCSLNFLLLWVCPRMLDFSKHEPLACNTANQGCRLSQLSQECFYKWWRSSGEPWCYFHSGLPSAQLTCGSCSGTDKYLIYWMESACFVRPYEQSSVCPQRGSMPKVSFSYKFRRAV